MYAAPEVLRYQPHWGVKSDAFAVGLIAVNLLAGRMLLPDAPSRTADFGSTVGRHRAELQAKQLSVKDGYYSNDSADVVHARELLWLRLQYAEMVRTLTRNLSILNPPILPAPAQR